MTTPHPQQSGQDLAERIAEKLFAMETWSVLDPSYSARFVSLIRDSLVPIREALEEIEPFLKAPDSRDERIGVSRRSAWAKARPKFIAALRLIRGE